MLCRAKINLTLHVGAAIPSGSKAGFHPVESLVVFADIGDILTFEPSERTHLTIDGPFSDGLEAGADNLIMRAMSACNAPPCHVRLTKHLPVSAGLGGGSANAAAILRQFDPDGRVESVSIGSDVPVCRLSRTAMMEGTGETVSELAGLGQIPAVLANPGIPVSTADVFNRYDSQDRAMDPARTDRQGALLDRALSGGNDLQATAIEQVPVIAEVIDMMVAQAGCQLARMSGSGASVFGVFETDEAAQAGANQLSKRGWWAVATRLGDAA